MPKSRNRKNHSKKVAARSVKLASQQKQMVKQIEELKNKYMEEQKEKGDSSTGEVPFTLNSK